MFCIPTLKIHRVQFHNQYCMQLLPIDDKQCRLNAKGEVAIQVRMIGSTAEKITSESITKGIESMHLVLARCARGCAAHRV